MSKRVITLGIWEGKPIEWIVLKEENFGNLVISKDRIARMQFDSNSSNNNWGSSSLRKYLNKDFFSTAFNDEEKKKIVNSHLDTTKDNVFLLTKQEVESLLLKDGDDPYENSYYKDCNHCCWTRTKDGSYVYIGYAKNCWCRHSSSNNFSVRPAMYVRKT